ncbi:MAG: D-alanyl-D-alanine carboxypeptidase/D-alanyl-D-alanine-endopeptidase [Phycisphaerales bacterium]
MTKIRALWIGLALAMMGGHWATPCAGETNRARASAHAARSEGLDRRLELLIEKASLGPVQMGVCLVDCRTGEVLAGSNQKVPLIPASNMKLLTSGVATLVLGPEFQFRTRLVRDGDKLVLIGGGDPAFGDPELLRDMKLSAGGLLDRLLEPAKAAKLTGIRQVVVDDRIFDRELVHPSWPVDQLNRWYCAEVTGLIFHTNVLSVFPTPGPRPGPAPMPALEPSAPWIEVVNLVQTVATGSTKIGAFRDAPLRFKVTGSIRAAPDAPIDVTVTDAPMMVARMLADRVAEAGLGGAGAEAPVWRRAEPGERLSDREVLAVVRTPLATVLRRCNIDSHNLYAEALIKLLGHEVTGQAGSWGTGATVLRMQIGQRVKLDNGELVVADGSGMSRDNRVSAQALARWLGAMSRAPAATAEAFIASLPVPGEGTLARRFRGRDGITGEVRAKSGFINGVQCLSGYVTHGDRRVAFSVLVNNITSQTPGGRVKAFHEDVVELVDQWLAGEAGGDQMGG